MKECQNAQPCLLSNYFTGKGQVIIDGEHFVVFGYCCDDKMTSQELPSRESSTHGTYKPIGERFAYEGIAPYANLSPIGLCVM